MAARKKTRTREAQLAFEALSIEGGLLSPDWLSRAAQLAAGGQAEADYRIPKGLNVRDEIGRFWRIAQAHWSDFATGRAGKADARLLAERFVEALLHDCFGFATISKVLPFVLDERSYPIGFAALGGSVPVVIVAPRPESAEDKTRSALDDPKPEFADGGRRRSAFGLAQEYLNAADRAMWGIASDGLTLRIIRDNASLTRPAWIAADLQRMFAEERYADFAALWLLAHETRFGRADQPVAECALETWRNAGREEGTRAREHLRRGVEDALIALGQGFLAHPDNSPLRTDLQCGALSTKDYFNQLLRLVYRLIFLLTVEERGVLHPENTEEMASSLYATGYSLRRLRERSVKRSAHDRFADLWEATKIVFRGVAKGETRLGLPALAGIFAGRQCPALDFAKLENRALLLAVFKLSWLREDSGLARVNWRDMGPEELGSVYESLLELVPQITEGGRQFAFAAGGETKGNARKTTGSYYTPESLVQVLLDNALEPVVKETIANNPADPVQALLGLSIVDPACGSGHFLLAGARRLAAHVARTQASGTPSAAEYRHALRQVVGRCIFGVDLNPMAVELCKVSLWMEAVEPGMPLTFLDAHIQQGNALLGTTPDLMAKGIPDAAWEPIEGDDKKIASALKKQNKQEAKELLLDFSRPPASTFARLGAGARAVDEEDDSTLLTLEAKAKHWAELVASVAFERQQFLADTWCAAFVWRKEVGALRDSAPTNGVFRALQQDAARVTLPLREEVERLREEYAWFHWPLRFPQVFGKGGFDVVLGNPPWERVKLQEQEFFASRSEEIANAVNSAARKKLIAKLQVENPQLWAEWSLASRKAEGESHIIRNSSRFPLCGKGDVNTYSIFAEHNRDVVGPRGRAGFIVPSGIATDDTTKGFFASLLLGGNLAGVYDFLNTGAANLFRDVGHDSFRFTLLTLARDVHSVDLVFDAREPAELLEPGRHCWLAPEEFALLNPNSRTCPTFRSRRDADISLAMYRRAGILWRDSDEEHGNPWKLRFMTMFHMANDSGLFRTRVELDTANGKLEGNRVVGPQGEYVPLLEAKMVHHFDHRYGDYADRAAEKEGTDTRNLPDVPISRLLDPVYQPLPRYWTLESEVSQRLSNRWSRQWLLGWRDICRSGLERTLTACLFPLVAVGHTMPLLMPEAETPLIACLYANLCSFIVDYATRQKIGGTHLTYSYLKQLPVLAPNVYAEDTKWEPGTMVCHWLLSRVLELAYTTWDLEPFARDVGRDGTPFQWSVERRFQMRCELDAAFFHLYGLSRADTDYLMETFPVVRKNDEKAHGEYRTKRVILEIYDALAKAMQTGKTYRSPLDPLPGAPGASHGTFASDGIPKDYAEALRVGLLFALIRRSGETGMSESALSRALLWLQDPKHSALWLEGTALADFERIRESDPLLAGAAGDSPATNLLEALETEKAITRDAKGIVRLRGAGSIPRWLPQTPGLTKLASVMHRGLERAEQGASTMPSVEKVAVGEAKPV